MVFFIYYLILHETYSFTKTITMKRSTTNRQIQWEADPHRKIMNTIMFSSQKMRQVIGLIFVLLIFLSCSKEDATPVATIKGKIISPMGENTGIPDIKVFLIDADFKIDTVTYKNQKAFIDSTVTNSQGEYAFDIYKPGHYAVYPKGNENFKTFAFADQEMSSKIEVKEGESKTIDFKAVLSFSQPILGFKLKITLKNFKKGVPKAEIEKNLPALFLYRRAWFSILLPFMDGPVNFPSIGFVEPDGSYTLQGDKQFDPPYGLPFLTNFQDNCFTLDVKYGDGDPKYLFTIALPYTQKNNWNADVIFDCVARTTSYKIF